MPEQLVFDLPVRPALGRSDFFVSDANALAVATISDWRSWPGGKLVITGPAASGKTHLMHVWAAETRAPVLEAAELGKADIAHLGRAPVAIDNAGAGVFDAAAERAFFHLHNELLANRQPLLVAARTPPRDWAIGLPDLLSRLSAAHVVRLEPPDDRLFAAVLTKLFADRQLAPSPAAVLWLTRHLERSFAVAAEAVQRLDRASLGQRRAVTRDFVARMVENWPDLKGEAEC